MGGLLTTGSIIAAFFAGAIALFSPCCVVFLFPAYLAAAVKNRRWKLLPLTLVFTAGLAVVLLPVTLGVSLLSGTLKQYHTPLYYVGGVLMLTFAAFAFLGRSWSMPSFIRAPSLARGDGGGMFAIGVFSGDRLVVLRAGAGRRHDDVGAVLDDDRCGRARPRLRVRDGVPDVPDRAVLGQAPPRRAPSVHREAGPFPLRGQSDRDEHDEPARRDRVRVDGRHGVDPRREWEHNCYTWVPAGDRALARSRVRQHQLGTEADPRARPRPRPSSAWPSYSSS